MVSREYFFNKIKDLKITDIFAVVPMLCAAVLIPFFRKSYSKTWLICEESMEARDNGFFFFKYMCTYQPQQKCVYAIKRKSVDYQRVKPLGTVIEFGGILHWLYYFLARYNISSQKGGKPNAALCAFMELNDLWNPHNIFLQHGIIINNLKWLYADRSKIDIFITSTKPEDDYIKENFGYNINSIKLTGLSRFDNLHDVNIKKNRILIMPTWRSWFCLKSKQNTITDNIFEISEYLYKWKELLESEVLNKLINQFNLEIIFYPHRNMQSYLNEFKNICTKVIIASWEEYDVQDLLKSSEMLITDYSSVFFDMIYMKKPILFYQFDETKFREFQYEQGYFDYHQNPFGKSFNTLPEVLKELGHIVEDNYKVSDYYLLAHKEYFKFYDKDNSKRIFELLQNHS